MESNEAANKLQRSTTSKVGGISGGLVVPWKSAEVAGDRRRRGLFYLDVVRTWSIKIDVKAPVPSKVWQQLFR